MSNVKEKEGLPLMEKPQPVPGQEPGLLPPPYSSLFVPQPQIYTQVPLAPIQTPHQDTNTDITDYGKRVTQPSYNPYVPTTYYPAAPTNDQTVIISCPSFSLVKTLRCHYVEIFIAIIVILILVGIGSRVHRKSYGY